MKRLSGIVVLSVMIMAGCAKNRKYEPYSEVLVKRAEAGDANAQSDLARCLFKGEGVAKNEQEGLKWARKAAEQGNACGQFTLGSHLAEGLGVTKDEKEGLKWITKSAIQGNAEGQYMLGRCYFLGKGVEKSTQEAFKWFSKSAEQGNLYGQYALGQFYAYGEQGGYGVTKDEKMAAKWFLKVAEHTNAESDGLSPEMKALIDAYKTVNATSNQENKDPSKMLRDQDQKNTKQVELTPAMKLLSDANKKAIFTDIPQADNAPILRSYNPVLLPDQKYSEKLQKKAESGDSIAQRQLGTCYFYGLGIKKDLSKAIELWGKAAYQSDLQAQCNLGSLYLKEQKYDKAYLWFKKAADGGDAYAMDKLGTLYNYGLGVEKNEKEGFRLHKKAAEQKDPCALFNLAVDYSAGRGTDKDIQMAIKFYSQAASAGSPEAQYDLGILYFDGIGVPQNNQKALELFAMAAAQGHQKAKDMLPVLKTLIKSQSSTNPQQKP
jgi:TPR repeat protein